MDNLTLTAVTGRSQGTGASRRLRADGQVPAVIYGRGGDPLPCALDARELRQVLIAGGSNALVSLAVDGNQTLALVKDLQRHPIRQTVSHVDFQRVDENERVTVEVPLVLIGESEEVAHAGATIEQIEFSVTVTCRVTAIPQELIADQSKITMTDPLTAADIQLPDDVELQLEPEDTIAVAKVTRATLAAEDEELEGEEARG